MTDEQTIVFIGITTGGSAVRKVFPKWMELLGAPVRLETVDIPAGSGADPYRRVIEDVAQRDDVLGAQITAHKTAVYDNAGDLFAGFSEPSREYGEVSVVARRTDGLHGTIIEPVTIGQTVRELGGGRSIITAGSDLVLYGAGGTAVSFLACLGNDSWPDADRPRRIHLVDVDAHRLQYATEIADSQAVPLRVVPHRTAGGGSLAHLGPLAEGSVIVNATGLGKDRPGAPFSLPAPWPKSAHVWDLNYRGDLLMLQSARSVDPDRGLHVHDGWLLFINGWAESLSVILDRPVTAEERRQMDVLAREVRS